VKIRGSNLEEPIKSRSSNVEEPVKNRGSKLEEPVKRSTSNFQEPVQNRKSNFEEPVTKNRTSKLESPAKKRGSNVEEPGKKSGHGIVEPVKTRKPNVEETVKYRSVTPPPPYSAKEADSEELLLSKSQAVHQRLELLKRKEALESRLKALQHVVHTGTVKDHQAFRRQQLLQDQWQELQNEKEKWRKETHEAAVLNAQRGRQQQEQRWDRMERIKEEKMRLVQSAQALGAEHKELRTELRTHRAREMESHIQHGQAEAEAAKQRKNQIYTKVEAQAASAAAVGDGVRSQLNELRSKRQADMEEHAKLGASNADIVRARRDDLKTLKDQMYSQSAEAVSVMRDELNSLREMRHQQAIQHRSRGAELKEEAQKQQVRAATARANMEAHRSATTGAMRGEWQQMASARDAQLRDWHAQQHEENEQERLRAIQRKAAIAEDLKKSVERAADKESDAAWAERRLENAAAQYALARKQHDDVINRAQASNSRTQAWKKDYQQNARSRTEHEIFAHKEVCDDLQSVVSELEELVAQAESQYTAVRSAPGTPTKAKMQLEPGLLKAATKKALT